MSRSEAGRLYVRHAARVRRWLARGAAVEDLDDLVHEVFIAVLTHAHRYDGRCKFETWLFAVTRNVLRRHWRLQKTLRTRDGQTRRLWSWLGDVAPPDRQLEQRHVRQQLDAALAGLDEKYRAAVLTAGERLAAPSGPGRPSTERVRWFRARKLLSRRLAGTWAS